MEDDDIPINRALFGTAWDCTQHQVVSSTNSAVIDDVVRLSKDALCYPQIFHPLSLTKPTIGSSIMSKDRESLFATISYLDLFSQSFVSVAEWNVLEAQVTNKIAPFSSATSETIYEAPRVATWSDEKLIEDVQKLCVKRKRKLQFVKMNILAAEAYAPTFVVPTSQVSLAEQEYLCQMESADSVQTLIDAYLVLLRDVAKKRKASLLCSFPYGVRYSSITPTITVDQRLIYSPLLSRKLNSIILPGDVFTIDDTPFVVSPLRENTRQNVDGFHIQRVRAEKQRFSFSISRMHIYKQGNSIGFTITSTKLQRRIFPFIRVTRLLTRNLGITSFLKYVPNFAQSHPSISTLFGSRTAFSYDLLVPFAAFDKDSNCFTLEIAMKQTSNDDPAINIGGLLLEVLCHFLGGSLSWGPCHGNLQCLSSTSSLNPSYQDISYIDISTTTDTNIQTSDLTHQQQILPFFRHGPLLSDAADIYPRTQALSSAGMPPLRDSSVSSLTTSECRSSLPSNTLECIPSARSIATYDIEESGCSVSSQHSDPDPAELQDATQTPDLQKVHDNIIPNHYDIPDSSSNTISNYQVVVGPTKCDLVSEMFNGYPVELNDSTSNSSPTLASDSCGSLLDVLQRGQATITGTSNIAVTSAPKLHHNSHLHVAAETCLDHFHYFLKPSICESETTLFVIARGSLVMSLLQAYSSLRWQISSFRDADMTILPKAQLLRSVTNTGSRQQDKLDLNLEYLCAFDVALILELHKPLKERTPDCDNQPPSDPLRQMLPKLWKACSFVSLISLIDKVSPRYVRDFITKRMGISRTKLYHTFAKSMTEIIPFARCADYKYFLVTLKELGDAWLLRLDCNTSTWMSMHLPILENDGVVDMLYLDDYNQGIDSCVYVAGRLFSTQNDAVSVLIKIGVVEKPEHSVLEFMPRRTWVTWNTGTSGRPVSSLVRIRNKLFVLNDQCTQLVVVDTAADVPLLQLSQAADEDTDLVILPSNSQHGITSVHTMMSSAERLVDMQDGVHVLIYERGCNVVLIYDLSYMKKPKYYITLPARDTCTTVAVCHTFNLFAVGCNRGIGFYCLASQDLFLEYKRSVSTIVDLTWVDTRTIIAATETHVYTLVLDY